MITKNVDKASAPIAILAFTGGGVGDAVLTGETVGGPALDFFRLTLQTVTVLSLSISDNAGVPPAIEQVTLKAQAIRLEYQQIDRGKLGPISFADINCAAGTVN